MEADAKMIKLKLKSTILRLEPDIIYSEENSGKDVEKGSDRDSRMQISNLVKDREIRYRQEEIQKLDLELNKLQQEYNGIYGAISIIGGIEAEYDARIARDTQNKIGLGFGQQRTEKGQY